MDRELGATRKVIGPSLPTSMKKIRSSLPKAPSSLHPLVRKYNRFAPGAPNARLLSPLEPLLLTLVYRLLVKEMQRLS